MAQDAIRKIQPTNVTCTQGRVKQMPGGKLARGKLVCLQLVSEQGSTPTPWIWSLRDQMQKWAPQTQKNPLFLGFSVLREKLGPWSRTMVSEGARPWGGGRSRDCELELRFATVELLCLQPVYVLIHIVPL